uniref:Large ribosomal subunit protein eL30 n=1 Tax=Pectinaria gouldii TaxID=260746 RepID=V5L306_PECGU|nr:60S ribosomal-like protein [Pectinaria gouldii]
MVATKKSKKASEGINSRLQLVIKTGKYNIGFRSTLRQLRSGKAKLVLIANNEEHIRKSQIEYYAMLAKVAVHHYNGSNIELGTACGKYFKVAVLTITDPGNSEIIAVNE